MIGIDTNILVRYFVKDDISQSTLAKEILVKNCSQENPGFISSIVLCELIWVLKGTYRYSKDQIIQLVQNLLLAEEICFENHKPSLIALEAFKNGNADFSDYLIANIAQNNGCTEVVTFDKKAGTYNLFSYIALNKLNS